MDHPNPAHVIATGILDIGIYLYMCINYSVYIYIYMHACMHTYIHTYIHAHAHTHTCPKPKCPNTSSCKPAQERSWRRCSCSMVRLQALRFASKRSTSIASLVQSLVGGIQGGSWRGNNNGLRPSLSFVTCLGSARRLMHSLFYQIPIYTWD